YKDDRMHGPITEAACWAHARRKFFVLADIATKARSRKPPIVSPIAAEAVKRFDAIFEQERLIKWRRAAPRRQKLTPNLPKAGAHLAHFVFDRSKPTGAIWTGTIQGGWS